MNQNKQWSLPARFLAFGVVFLFLALFVWYIRRVLEPLIIAAFIAYLINPLVNLLTRRTKIKRGGAVALVYFLTLALLIGIPATIMPVLFEEFKRVVTDILNLFNQLIIWLMEPQALPIPGIPIDLGQLANRLTQFRSTFLSSLPEQAIQLLSKTSVTALWVLVIMVAVYYFLADWPKLRNGFINSFPESRHEELQELYQRVRQVWMNYLRGQLLLMLIVGVVFTIAWFVIGIPGALVLGLAAGLLTLIPDVGPFLAVLLAGGVALLEGSNWGWMPTSHFIVFAIVLGIYAILISVKNFWLRPFIMGRSVHMNEALVLIVIILATVLWGILGALLVVPVFASVVVIFDYLRRSILGMPPFPSTEMFVAEEKPVSGSERMAAIKSRLSRMKKG
jgi:predicted PurR-regulated permease PerM